MVSATPVATTPPAVVAIAQRVSRQEEGVVILRLRRTFDVHAGPMHRHDESELAVITQNGAIVKVRVIRATIGGRPADAAAAAQIERGYEHPAAGDVFHRPFDPRYVNEYTIVKSGPQTFGFTSLIHDSSHGDGTFTIDGSGNVVGMRYTPKVFPPYATAGTVTQERGPVLEDYWSLTQETYSYTGRYAIFSGGATAVIQYDQFKRFPDLQSATGALNAGTL